MYWMQVRRIVTNILVFPIFVGTQLRREWKMVHFAKKKNTNGTFRETRKIKIWDLVRQIMLKADILEILGNFTSRH